MIKGWRKDPAWLAHYKKVEEERTVAVMRRVALENEIHNSLNRINSGLNAATGNENIYCMGAPNTFTR